jgi:hypothetical protein
MGYNYFPLLLLLQALIYASVVCGFLALRQQRRPNSSRCQAQDKLTKLCYDRCNDQFERLTVAGASVSSLGFLVVVNSTIDEQQRQVKVAFPIQLTSSGTMPTADSNNNLTIPSLFQENIDQTSVTTPEALTFLQLINGVDMATPILPPDTLSLLCVWYSFLLNREPTTHETGVLIEDELGLDLSANAGPETFYPAFDYVRSFVATMLPDSVGFSKSSNFLNLTEWQRAKVRLPSVRLRGVRVEGMQPFTQKTHQSAVEIETIPLKFVLECAVDDDSQALEVPLFSIPASYDKQSFQSKDAIELSEQVLQVLSHNFNSETSASFIALSLFQRYRKSKGATLRVSQQLLKYLVDLQNSAKRYCWVQTLTENTSMNSIIRSTGLPSYRTMRDLKESDKRVLGYLEEQNFDKSPTDATSYENFSSSRGSIESSNKNTKSLTVEQLSMQQKLKSAWKVATEKNDAAALEKIQKAMQDFETQLEAKARDEKESSLQRIKRAMRESQDEETVGLIAELEDSIDSDFDERRESA